MPKYVASRTLVEPLSWHGSSLLGEPFAERVADLKDRHGELHVIGSLDLLQSLLRLRLVDRVSLWLYPLLLGSGKRVFGRGTVPTAMRLTESAAYANALHLVYETAGSPTFGEVA